MKTLIKKIELLIMVVAILGTASTVQAGKWSDIKKENRKVADFNEIALALPADLYLTQGAKNEVIIEADDDVQKVYHNVADM